MLRCALLGLLCALSCCEAFALAPLLAKRTCGTVHRCVVAQMDEGQPEEPSVQTSDDVALSDAAQADDELRTEPDDKPLDLIDSATLVVRAPCSDSPTLVLSQGTHAVASLVAQFGFFLFLSFTPFNPFAQ